MKILILQLARLGDIYLTWPVVRALREAYPDAQIDLMVRRRFRGAVHGLDQLNCVWLFDSQMILQPVLQNAERVSDSIAALDGLIDAIHDQGYDRILNLSFSPMSSFLCSAFSTNAAHEKTTQICGYTRTSDGFLALPDDGSAYFYAQVGVGRTNRVHLCDLFAHVCGVDLRPHHWNTAIEMTESFAKLGEYVVVHPGASQESKMYSPAKWAAVIRHLLKEYAGQVILIGAREEQAMATYIEQNCDSDRLLNFVGRTRVFELFELIQGAKLLIGADSAPIHIASLVSTPCLNLSFGAVNFWETGPRALGSRVLYEESPDGLPSDRVAQEALQLLAGLPALSPVISLKPGYVAFDDTALDESRQLFDWQLTSGLYMGEPLPAIVSENVLRGLSKIIELNGIALAQFDEIQAHRGNSTTYLILDRVDDTIDTLTRIVPEMTPLVRWYQTEKIRLQPMPIEELVQATRNIHEQLQNFLFSFTGMDPRQPEGVSHDVKIAIG
jgi:ADP-heptose:LPS heptosyltransferase